MILYMTLQKGTNTYVHLHQPKKVTSRGQGAGVKNKIQEIFFYLDMRGVNLLDIIQYNILYIIKHI